MSALQLLLSRRRLVLTLATVLSVVGLVAWLEMPRQEDPDWPARWGQLVVVFPGAEAQDVERLVVKPIEERLAEVDEVRHLDLVARSGAAVGFIELRESVRDVDPAWDQVRLALGDAGAEMPDAVAGWTLDQRADETQSVLVAVHGADPLTLSDAAATLHDRLGAIPNVARVVVTADPGEQVTIEFDQAQARSTGLDAMVVAAQLAPRNVVLPGGTIRAGKRQLVLRPKTEFGSVDEIAATPIMLPSGAAVPLNEIATVRLGPVEPAQVTMRHDGQPAVAVGVVPRPGVDVVEFGEQVRQVLDASAAELAPVVISQVVYQPEHVERRLGSLGWSLVLGILIVAVVLVMAMGPRLGLTVAAVVPLVALSSLGIYAMAGGTLHQISIAALVLSLGMLVDNAIVVAESIQRRMDDGNPRLDAALGAVRELALPLATATGTTMAAFVPMLLARGVTADFTRSLPVVIMLTLGISYLFAISVTPALGLLTLRAGQSEDTPWLDHFAGRLGRWTMRRPWIVVAGAAALVAISLAGATRVRQQFFPASDRSLVIVDLELPEGTHLDDTDDAAGQLERALLVRPDVVSVTTFVGRGAPKFYYNLIGTSHQPHVAQMVVRTVDRDAVDDVCMAARREALAVRPLPRVVAARIEQGPPVGAPVQVRLMGSSLEDLDRSAELVTTQLRQVEGTADVRHDLGTGVPTLRWSIHDEAAARQRIDREDVARALLQQSRGLTVGQLRAGDEPVPIVIRSTAGEATSPDALGTVLVRGGTSPPVPLDQLATRSVAWRPAAISRHDGSRMVTVSAQLTGDATFSDVLGEFDPRMATLALPDGIRWEYGGEAEGSGEANSSMLKALPLGLILLLFFLLAEFNSYRRVGIVLATIPLAASGVVPGLLLGGQPFGFMSMLGVIALVGIVVNNAIVLVDRIDRQRADGDDLDDALVHAVTLRARPILLTTATTVAGLIPLALSASPLWPPLAWAMISGLLASTALTLVVVPALYRLLFFRQLATPGTGTDPHLPPPRTWRSVLRRLRVATAADAGSHI